MRDYSLPFSPEELDQLLAKAYRLGGDTPFASPLSPQRDVDVVMQDIGRIVVESDTSPKIIGTSSLGGCGAFAAVVEYDHNARICALAHYDPITLTLIKGLPLTTISKVLQRGEITNAATFVMLPEVEELAADVKQSFQAESRHFLSCETIILPYGNYPGGDRLDITVPPVGTKAPSYSTKMLNKTLDW